MFSFVFSLSVQAQGGKDLTIIRETNKSALVIGNSDYRNGFSKLKSPGNDASSMAEALKRLGFRLVGGKAHIDVTFAEMEKLVDKFTEELRRGGVGFFYFSGHGSQDINKDNFLIPVDTQISYQSDLKHRALKLEFITSRMEEANNRLNILVLDACRNNPLPSGFKSGDNGLNTNREIPSGVYIAFAARDGQTAADGDYNGYSLYTRELLKNIETPNERLEDIFIRTRIAVKNETGNKQFPIDYGSIDGRFYFKLEETSVPNNSSQNIPAASNLTLNVSAERKQEAWKFYQKAEECNDNDYDCKISNYSKAIANNPNEPIFYNNRGIIYLEKQMYDLAVGDHSRAIALNPNNASYYNNRGVAYDFQKNYDLAIRDYSKAIDLAPDDLSYYKNRADAYESIGEKAKAKADRIKAGRVKNP